MEKLKPCPFCGGEAKVILEQVAEDCVHTYVQCQGCFARTEGIESAYSDRENAIEEWNNRPEQKPPALPEDVEGKMRRIVENYRDDVISTNERAPIKEQKILLDRVVAQLLSLYPQMASVKSELIRIADEIRAEIVNHPGPNIGKKGCLRRIEELIDKLPIEAKPALTEEKLEEILPPQRLIPEQERTDTALYCEMVNNINGFNKARSLCKQAILKWQRGER